MELDELASQFGGKRVQMDSSDDLAAQFGGKKVVQEAPEDDLAAQFGGKKIVSDSSVTVQGLPEQPKTPEPTVFQRVKDIAASPIEAIMGKDAFKESAPSPSPIKGSVKKGFLNVEQSVLQNQLASLMDLQAADKEKYGETYQTAPADQLDKISARDKTIQDKLRSVANLGLQRKAVEDKEGVFELSKSLKDLYSTKEYKDSSFLEGLGMIGDKVANNPSGIPGWIAGVGIESLPQSMVTVAAALAARMGGMGPKGAAIVGGSGSSFMEFGGVYADLRAQGLSHEQAWEEAGVKSAIIGLFDAASFNAAGKSAGTVFKNIEKGALKETVKDVSKGVGVQALYGGAGEGLGSFAINQKVDPGAVLEEMVGEVFGAPVEAVSTYQEKKAEANIPEAPPTQPGAPPQNTPEKQITKDYLNSVTRYRGMGLSREDSEQLAEEELKEAGYEPELITRARESSVSTPDVQTDVSRTTQGATGTEPVGLGGTSGTAGNVGVGTEDERSTLVESLKAKYNLTDEQANKQADESLRQKQMVAGMGAPSAPSASTTTPPSGLTPEQEQRRIDLRNILEAGTFDETQGRAIIEELTTLGNLAEGTAPATTTPPDVTTPPAPPVKVGKPRGRPKADKTPEQQAAADTFRKQRQTVGRNAITDITKAEKILGKVVDEQAIIENSGTEKEAQDTLYGLREERIGALEIAHSLSVDPDQKNKAAGKRATALLEKANPQERELGKQRHEAKQKIGAPSRAQISESTNGQDNTAFEQFDFAKGAVNFIAKNGNSFEKALAQRLAPFLNGVKFVVVDSAVDMPTTFLQRKMEGAAGLYVPDRKTIYVMREGGTNNTVVLHEALHAATVSRIDAYLQLKQDEKPIPSSLRVPVVELMETMAEAKELYDKLKSDALLLEDLGQLTPEMLDIPEDAFTDIKEFVAYGLSLPAMQDFLLLAPGEYAGEAPGFISKLFNKFVQSLRKMFDMGENHKSALQDLIIVTNKLLSVPITEEAVAPSEAVAAKKTKAATKKVDKSEEKLRLSSAGTTEGANAIVGLIDSMTKDGHSFSDYLELLNASFDSTNNEIIERVLYGLPSSDILRWKGDEIAGLSEVDKLTQEMSSMRTNLLAASAKKADKLGKFVNKNGMQVLADAMHMARLEKVSPTKAPNATAYIAQDPIIKHYEKLLKGTPTKAEATVYKGQITKRTNSINKVYAKWEALGKQKGGHEMYEMVRQFYIDSYNATRKLLDDQISELSIDDAAKKKLLKSVRLMQEQTKGGKDEDYDGVEVPALPEEYFPFLRYGKYWLRVAKGPTGREFYLFESGKARNKFLINRARELGQKIDDPNFSAGDDISSLRKEFQQDSAMLQEMFKAIDETKATDKRFSPSNYPNEKSPEAAATAALENYKEELKDQLYQTYLMTMPERSFRKQFLHAENITGFTSDVFRNFKTSATNYANQLAKLKYSTKIMNEVQRAQDSLEGMPALKQAKLGLFVKEIALRAKDEINPPDPGQVATRINQFAFGMLLTSAASAAVQMLSVPIMVMTTLNPRYGYGSSAKTFAKYSQLWKSIGITEEEANGDISHTAPSIGSSKMVRNNPILKRAFEAALDRGVTTLTNTSIITNRNRTPDSSYSNIPGTAARVLFNGMSAMFNGSERMSREITFMMTFELEYAKNKDFDAAVDVAVKTTQELLGRYDSFDRPRIMRNFAGRTVGQFKMYAVYMTSFFLRNGYQIIRLSTPKEERIEAMHRLTGVLTMGGLFHGLVGMPAYSLICAVIDAFFDGDEEEKKLRRAKNPLISDDSDLRFRYKFLPETFGNITLPGLDGRQHRLSEMLEKGPVSVLTDINFGSRTSFDSMWFREAKPGKTFVETMQNYLIANLGPGVSTGFNFVGGIEDLTNGHIRRGLEKLSPAFFRGTIVASRFNEEGAETKGGADMLKKSEISDLNLIAAIIGFQPTRLARIQEHNFQIQKQLIEASNKRSKILKKLDEVTFDTERGPSELKAVFNQIREYNKRYPMEKFLIDADTINNSLEAYAKKRGQTYRGLYMDKKLMPYLIPSAKQAAPVPETQ